jgi:hypothetical protein
MKTATTLILVVGLVVFLACSGKSVMAEEFPLAVKAWEATVVHIEGRNSSKALAVGEVKRSNAEEYCERDPGGITKQYGGKLTKEQCVQRLLSKEKGKRYSASADCPRKAIKTSWDETFTAIGKDSLGNYIWQNVHTGKVLDGSNASGAPVVQGQFKMLCPAYVNP